MNDLVVALPLAGVVFTDKIFLIPLYTYWMDLSRKKKPYLHLQVGLVVARILSYVISIMYYIRFDFTSNINHTVRGMTTKNITHPILPFIALSVIAQYSPIQPNTTIGNHKLIPATKE